MVRKLLIRPVCSAMFFDCRRFTGTKHVASPIVLGTSPIPNTREDATKKTQ